MRQVSLALLAAAALAAPGCMETTVKPTTRRVVSGDDSVKAARDKETDEEAKSAPPVLPTRPQSLEEEADRLRAQVEKEPQQPKWHFLLGQVYEKQNRFELAELRYRRGAELIPADQYTGPHYVIGRVLAKQQKWAQALAELNKAVAVKPPDLEGYYLNPDYRESYFLIGAIDYRLGDLGGSERAFRQFLKYGGETNRVVEFFPELVAE